MFDSMKAELERLRGGNFTPSEVHDFCHILPETVTPEEFAKGCEDYQVKLYGRCPTREHIEKLETLLKDIEDILQKAVTDSSKIENEDDALAHLIVQGAYAVFDKLEEI